MSSRIRRLRTVIDAPPPAVRTRLFTFMNPCASLSPASSESESESPESSSEFWFFASASSSSFAPSSRVSLNFFSSSRFFAASSLSFSARSNLSTTREYSEASKPLYRSRFCSNPSRTSSCTNSSGAMSAFDFLALTARGRSTQSFLLCVIAPQFSHAPLRNLVAWNVFTPRLYHDPDAPSPSFLSTSFHAFWCFRPFFCSRYHGAAAMNCGMCGLISLPSSSRSAGARPACTWVWV